MVAALVNTMEVVVDMIVELVVDIVVYVDTPYFFVPLRLRSERKTKN